MLSLSRREWVDYFILLFLFLGYLGAWPAYGCNLIQGGHLKAGIAVLACWLLAGWWAFRPEKGWLVRRFKG